jgi:hypothetical protein
MCTLGVGAVRLVAVLELACQMQRRMMIPPDMLIVLCQSLDGFWAVLPR